MDGGKGEFNNSIRSGHLWLTETLQRTTRNTLRWTPTARNRLVTLPRYFLTVRRDARVQSSCAPKPTMSSIWYLYRQEATKRSTHSCAVCIPYTQYLHTWQQLVITQGRQSVPAPLQNNKRYHELRITTNTVVSCSSVSPEFQRQPQQDKWKKQRQAV